MSRFTAKEQLVEDIVKERQNLESLLSEIPAPDKTIEITDGMAVKDFLAHRTEWGRMMTGWYEQAKSGKTPAVPSAKYKWNQLRELNTEIFEAYKDTPLKQIERDFQDVHD